MEAVPAEYSVVGRQNQISSRLLTFAWPGVPGSMLEIPAVSALPSLRAGDETDEVAAAGHSRRQQAWFSLRCRPRRRVQRFFARSDFGEGDGILP
jgi:hypothetical protein